MVKVVVLPKLVCRFNAVPIIYAENDKEILKYMWKCKGLRVAKTVLQTRKVGGLILLDFKIIIKITDE